MGLPVDQCRNAAIEVCSKFGVDLEDFSVSKAGRREIVRVVVDRDGGVDLDSIAEISRLISESLDVIVTDEESPFVLEVSSPGVDRPLTEPRHWRRAIGHLVEIDADGFEKPQHLRITAFDGQQVELTDDQGNVRLIPTTQVSRAVVQVEFNRGE